MKIHKCLKGRHDYKPGHGNLPTFKNKGFDIIFDIHENAWFDPTVNGPIGKDGKDWNKVGGVSFINPLSPRTWRKNSNAAMIAWRPSIKEGYFEICAYTNDAKGKWLTSPVKTVKSGEGVGVSCTISRRAVKYYVQGMEVTHKIRRTFLCVPVGPWFGGNRKSPQSHTIFSRFLLKK